MRPKKKLDSENASVYRLLPSIYNYKILIDCVFAFGCRKGKTGNLIVSISEVYIFFYFFFIWSILGTEKVYLPVRVGFHGEAYFCYI